MFRIQRFNHRQRPNSNQSRYHCHHCNFKHCCIHQIHTTILGLGITVTTASILVQAGNCGSPGQQLELWTWVVPPWKLPLFQMTPRLQRHKARSLHPCSSYFACRRDMPGCSHGHQVFALVDGKPMLTPFVVMRRMWGCCVSVVCGYAILWNTRQMLDSFSTVTQPERCACL